MSSTYLSLRYHIVFSTKDRRPLIRDTWRDRLHDYFGGTINGLGGYAEELGGVADHVHLLVGLKATHCLADFVRELKKASTKWVHAEVGVNRFSWQEGYAAFTVSATSRAAVQLYIQNQAEHHRVKSFSEELKKLLMKANVEYKQDYLE